MCAKGCKMMRFGVLLKVCIFLVLLKVAGGVCNATMDEVLKLALTRPPQGGLAAEAEPAPAVSDDAITH